MMKYKVITIIMATFFLTVSLEIKHAAAYRMLGFGAQSCGSWTSNREILRMTPENQTSGTVAFHNMTWVLGFLSGIGFVGNGMDPLDGIDREAVGAWIDRYCRENPLKNIAEAAGMLAVAHPRK